MKLSWSDWIEEDWEKDANCKGSDSALFFTSRGLQHFKARQICAQCSVREQCTAFATVHNQEFGYWGSTANDRRISRRDQRNDD